jgi:hypothetical protein
MCGKPGKGRHGTSHHAKAIYLTINKLSKIIFTEQLAIEKSNTYRYYQLNLKKKKLLIFIIKLYSYFAVTISIKRTWFI